MACTKIFHKNEKGQAIIESVMCMLVTFLILFGLLQIFYLSVAQMITDYSAFTSARSAAVGFLNDKVIRNARVASIGASGRLVMGGAYGLNQDESMWIQDYIGGNRELDYEYWYSANNSTNTSLSLSVDTNSGGMSRSLILFNNYPINFPMKGAFTNADSTDIRAEGGIMNSCVFFTE